METLEHDPQTEDGPEDDDLGSARVRRTDHEQRLIEAVRANVFPGLVLDRDQGDDAKLESVARIGRYAIVRKLGEGGMGVVFAGYDEQLDRKVAVKLLRARAHSRVAKLRLEREAQALARLSHPNVVQIYELGEHHGAVFVAMEFVVGETLRAWLGEALPRLERPWRETVEVLRQAGAGLAAAHAAGLVHRDFKPDNVIVGADGRARVLDFGLVREATGLELTKPDRSDANQDQDHALDPIGDLTRAGAVLGTPAYMAPEQLAARPCDALTDQFGFCVTAFEALFGRRPFAGDSVASLADAIGRGEMVTIPEAHAVPQRLRAAIIRGLACDPSERWPDMPTLLAELDRALDRGRRRRRLAWAAGVAAVFVSAGVSAWSVGAKPTLCVFDETALAGTWDDARREALGASFGASLGFGSPALGDRSRAAIQASLDAWSTRWLASRRSTCEATRIVGDQSEAMLDLRSGCLERQRREATALVDLLIEPNGEGIARAFELLDRLPDPRECEDPRLGETSVPLPSQPKRREAILAAYAQLSRARALGSNGRPDQADAIANALRSAHDELDYVPLRIELQALAGEQRLWRQAVDEAVPLLRAAIREAEIAGLDELSATLRSSLATQVVGQWGTPEVQAEVLDEAEIAVARIGRSDDLRTIQLGLMRAAWLDDTGDYEAALAGYRASIGLASEAVGEGKGEAVGLLGLAQREHAQLLARLERFDAAEQAFAEARASFVTHRPGSLVIADIELDLGLLALGRGRFEAAAQRFNRARALYEPRVAPDSVNLSRLALAEAKLALFAGELERAAEHFAQVTEVATDDRLAGDAWEGLGVVRFYQGEFAESIAAYERALVHRLASYGPEHPDVGLLRANLGESLAAAGDHVGALAAYAEALTILSRALPPDHSDLAIPYKGRAQSRLALGDADGARVDLERALALHEANPGEPLDHADVEFTLARTLAELGQRERALSLATAARQRSLDHGQLESAAAIAAWLDP